MISGDGELAAIYGDGKMGKSTYAREQAANLLGPGVVGVYSTPHGETSDPCRWPETEDVSCDEVRAFTQLPYGICLRGQDPDEVCGLVRELALAGYRVVWICDEAQETFPHGFSSKGPAGRIFHASRHLGIQLVCVTRWPSRIDSRVFYAATRTVWFRLSASRNLQWIEREYGEQAARDVAGLRPHEYIEVDRDDLPRGWQRYTEMSA